METRRDQSVFAMLLRHKADLLLLAAVACLSSCVKGDEELHRELIELRAAVDAKNRAVEQLQSQVVDLQSKSERGGSPPPAAPVPDASKEELAKAQARIAELEQQLATASTAAPPQSGKFDMEEIAGRLEEDLTRKAKQLRQLVQRQSPSSRIDEISLKSIEYPSQLVTPFTSAITFTVTSGAEPPMRLMFPVTADLSGSWKLPTPDEVQKAYRAAQEQPTQGLASAGTPTPQAQPKAQAQAPPSPAPAAGGARMTQREDGVFIFDWGDGSAAASQPRQPQQASAQPAAPQMAAPQHGPQTVHNFLPPGKQGGKPQAQAQGSVPPAAAPRAPSAAPQPSSVPAPVMPIVGDRIIRFND